MEEIRPVVKGRDWDYSGGYENFKAAHMIEYAKLNGHNPGWEDEAVVQGIKTWNAMKKAEKATFQAFYERKVNGNEQNSEDDEPNSAGPSTSKPAFVREATPGPTASSKGLHSMGASSRLEPGTDALGSINKGTKRVTRTPQSSPKRLAVQRATTSIGRRPKSRSPSPPTSPTIPVRTVPRPDSTIASRLSSLRRRHPRPTTSHASGTRMPPALNLSQPSISVAKGAALEKTSASNAVNKKPQPPKRQAAAKKPASVFDRVRLADEPLPEPSGNKAPRVPKRKNPAPVAPPDESGLERTGSGSSKKKPRLITERVGTLVPVEPVSELINSGASSSVAKQARQKKRDDYISWEEFFMAVSFLAAQRSKDPSSQVGACIVNSEKKIVATGYNGMPNGCSDDELPWNREGTKWLETKYPYVCHAEMNAICNKNSASVKDCSLYVALFPCNECAKLCIQSGIKQLVYMSDKYKDKDEFKASRRLLEMAGIQIRQFVPRQRQVVVDFGALDPTIFD